MADSSAKEDVAQFLPDELREIESLQTALPRIAKDCRLMALIEATLRGISTRHDLHLHNARELFMLEPRSVHIPRSRVLLDTRLIHDSWRKGCRDERTKARGGFGGGRP